MYSTPITRNADSASKLLKAISNPNRLMILSQLRLLGGQSASQLLTNLSLSQPALSQHLAIMLDEGLIAKEKKGKVTHYRINAGVVSELLELLDRHFSQSL